MVSKITTRLGKVLIRVKPLAWTFQMLEGTLQFRPLFLLLRAVKMSLGFYSKVHKNLKFEINTTRKI